METTHIELRALLISLIVIVFSDYIAYQMLSDTISNPVLLTGILRFLQSLFIVFIIYYPQKSLSAIGLDRSTLMKGVSRGAIWSFGFFCLTVCGFTIIYLAGKNPISFFRSNTPKTVEGIVIYAMVVGVIGPIAEEIFFRGVVYGFFRRWGMIVAVILTTVFFVSVHTLGRGLPVIQIVGGILFSVSYEIEKNLLVPVIIHCSGNLALFVLSIYSGYL